MPKAFVYCRSSTDRQSITTKDQAQRGDAYFKAKLADKGVTFAGFYIDEAVTSDKPLDRRPFGAAMLRDLEKDSHIICTDIDRCFRSFREAVAWLEKWREQGVTVHVIERGLDTSTDVGVLVLSILAWVGQVEKKLIKERTARAMAHVVRNRKPGSPLNQNPPLGFRIEGTRGSRRLVRNDAERAIMAQIVEMKDVRHWQFEQVYFAMLQQGVKNRSGKPWSLSGVQRAFRQELKLRKQESKQLETAGAT